MNIADFRQFHKSRYAEKRRMFALCPPDPPASDEQIGQVEHSLGVILPATYRAFLKEFGGGDFGLVTVFSADPAGEWYLPRKQSEAGRYLPAGLLAFSDDHAGGYYALRILEGEAREPVYYWNDDGGLDATEFANVLEFIARYAYE